MSNHLAIATVSAAFSRQVLAAAQLAVQNATLRVGPPDAATATSGDPVLNVFLYQVTPDPQLRNEHLPNRRADGTLLERSRVVLDLRYVLTFYGDATKFEPELMVGAVAAAVEDRPLLSRTAIEHAVDDATPVLDTSDLREALSAVRISPDVHTLEELSRMWSIFFQVPYALSVSYLCSHVTIEVGGDAVVPLPVADPRTRVAPFSRMRIDALTSAEGPTRPIVWGGSLVVSGAGLGQPGLTLRVGEHEVVPSAGEGAGELLVPLDAATFGGADLPAGHHRVRAVAAAAAAPDRLTAASEARVFALRPTLTVEDAGLEAAAPDPASGTMRVAFVPPVAEGQSVALLLDQRTAVAPATARLEPEPPAGGFPAAALRFPYAGLPRGPFLLRAVVDGVESAPSVDRAPGSPTAGQITGPEVDLS